MVFDTPATLGNDMVDAVMVISCSSVSEGVSSKDFQLHVWILGREVLMLIDSGSSTSFINQQLVNYINDIQPLQRAYMVRLADGGELICSSVRPAMHLVLARTHMRHRH